MGGVNESNLNEDQLYLQNIHILKVGLENTFIATVGFFFQKHYKMNSKFSHALIKPLLENLIPLYIWTTVVGEKLEFPDLLSCFHQLLCTLFKLVTIYYVSQRFSNNVDNIVLSFLLLTNTGLLYPSYFVGDRDRNIKQRFLEDCLILNLFSRVFYIQESHMRQNRRALQEIERRRYLFSSFPHKSELRKRARLDPEDGHFCFARHTSQDII